MDYLWSGNAREYSIAYGLDGETVHVNGDPPTHPIPGVEVVDNALFVRLSGTDDLVEVRHDKVAYRLFAGWRKGRREAVRRR